MRGEDQATLQHDGSFQVLNTISTQNITFTCVHSQNTHKYVMCLMCRKSDALTGGSYPRCEVIAQIHAYNYKVGLFL